MLQKLFIVVALIFVLTSCGEEENRQEITKSYFTHIVTTWKVATQNSYVGYTAWQTEVMLAAKTPGRIVYMRKNVWDSVRKWELLVELDSAEAKVWASNAASIAGSLYSLRKETAKAFDGQIKALDAKVNQVKAWIQWVKVWLEDVKKITKAQLVTVKTWIAQAKLWLETAELNLEETQKTLSTQDDNIVSWWKSAIIQSIILYKNIIDFSDKFLGITQNNKRYNDKFEDYLWAKNSQHLKQTEQLFVLTKKWFDEYEKYYLETVENKNPSKEEIIVWLKLAEKTAEQEKILLKELYSVVDNSIKNMNFPRVIMDEYQKNISTFGSQIEGSLLSSDGAISLWIKGSLDNFKNFEAQQNKWVSLLEKQVELAQASLKTAEETYNQYKLTSDGEVNKVQTQRNISKEQLWEVYAWIQALKAQKQASLKEIDAKIAEVNGWKKTAWVMIQNGKVYSTISGIITGKMWEQWQVVNAWMPLYSISDNSKLKVKLSIDFDAYRYIKKGKQVHISLWETDYSTTWKVSLVSKSAHKFSKKYDIEVEMRNPKWLIPVGAMVSVLIKTKSKASKNKIESALIPNEAIISKFMLPSVFVLKDNVATLTSIKIIKMWEKFSEVSWIKSLDTIIIKWQENISDWEVLVTQDETKVQEEK